MIRIGIEIGGTKLQAALVREPGEILLRVVAPIDPAAGAAGLRDVLAARLAGTPVALENDTNAAALAARRAHPSAPIVPLTPPPRP